VKECNGIIPTPDWIDYTTIIISSGEKSFFLGSRDAPPTLTFKKEMNSRGHDGTWRSMEERVKTIQCFFASGVVIIP